MSKVVAFDTETTLIGYPDMVCPDLVCLTMSNGEQNTIYTDDATIAFKKLLSKPDVKIVGHNVAFDLHVMAKADPSLVPLIWKAMRAGRVHDTLLREKLYLLSTTGNVMSKKCSLADLLLRRAGIDISSDKQGDDIWRLRYGELVDVPLKDWPKEAVQYAIDDAYYTWLVYQDQESKRKDRGPGSMNSEQLQVMSAFALFGMTINGMCIDQSRVAEIKKECEAHYYGALEKLQEYGLVKPNGKRDQKAIEALCQELGVTETTATGRTKTDKKTLAKIQSDDPRYSALMEYMQYLKAVTTFIPQMQFDRIHPRFDVIKNTLRTSCMSSDYYKHFGKPYGKKVIKQGSPYPSINLQQMPRDGNFREAFVPEEGYLLAAADYSNLELVSAAQQYYSLFGESKLRETLNAGTNLHDATGTIIYNDYKGTDIDLERFRELIAAGDKDAKFCRQSAKFVNLGCPGGQSAGTICALANDLGIPITLTQATAWRAAARDQFPEFAKFFDTYFPTLRNGSMYVPSLEKMKPRYDAEIYGVYKVKATFTAMANSVSMQMPSAIGKKIAMVNMYEACTNPTAGHTLYGCVPALDMHDEFLINVPEARGDECLEALMEIMIDGMQKVFPDMRVGVEGGLMRRWYKDGDPDFELKQKYKEPRCDKAGSR